MRFFLLVIAMVVFAESVSATGNPDSAAPSADDILKLKKKEWQRYYAGSAEYGIPKDAKIKSISNIKCEYTDKSKQKYPNPRIGFERFFSCEYDMNYTSHSSGSGSYKGFDFFAKYDRNKWTNSVISF